jgi:nucleoside-diphosphate-sugar epimerase
MRQRDARVFALTGATGFLGSHLMDALIRKGRSPMILGRRREGMSLADRVAALLAWFDVEDRGALVETAEVDLLEPRRGLERHQYDALCGKVSEIIHCASDTRFSERSRREATESNVHALPGIIRLAKDSRARYFHYVSTAYVSGPGPAPEAPIVSRTFSNVYEETKAEAERQVAARCSLQATPFTIVRPSIVYGDSVTGRSNRFNALHYHVRALGLIRDIYLNDISQRGGRKSREIDIHLDADGILHLPLRIFLVRRGHVNLIPVDYFVAVMLSVLESPRSGRIYHITSDAPRTTEELAAYCERFLGIRGIEMVYGEGPNGGVQNPPEEIFNKLVRPYLPYLSDTRSFDRTNTKSLATGFSAPDLTYDVFERCMRYAVRADWGNGNGKRDAGVSGASDRGEREKEETENGSVERSSIGRNHSYENRGAEKGMRRHR